LFNCFFICSTYIFSLSTTILRRRISGALNASKETQKAAELVSQNTIYNHPSINKLATFIVTLVSDPDSILAVVNKTDAIEEMIGRYVVGLEHPIGAGSPSNGVTVLITGTTGNLGSQILEILLKDNTISKIYALNRTAGDVRKRHADRFKDKGFSVDLLLSPKLVLLEGDITQKNAGLEKDVYQEVWILLVIWSIFNPKFLGGTAA